MRKVEDGDLSVQAPVQTQDEIGYLTLSFNRMVNNLRRFVLKIPSWSRRFTRPGIYTKNPNTTPFAVRLNRILCTTL